MFGQYFNFPLSYRFTQSPIPNDLSDFLEPSVFYFSVGELFCLITDAIKRLVIDKIRSSKYCSFVNHLLAVSLLNATLRLMEYSRGIMRIKMVDHVRIFDESYTTLYEFTRVCTNSIRDPLFTTFSLHIHQAPAQQLARLRLLNEQV